MKKNYMLLSVLVGGVIISSTIMPPKVFGEDALGTVMRENLKENSAPIIYGENIHIELGKDFNPLDYIWAYDNEDGDIGLTEKNIIENNVDVNKEGGYSLVCEVTDKDGNTTRKNIKVIVEAYDYDIVFFPGDHGRFESNKDFEEEIVTSGNAPKNPPVVIPKEGYRFIGWQKEIDIPPTFRSNRIGEDNTVTDLVTDISKEKIYDRIIYTAMYALKPTSINEIPKISAEDRTITLGEKFEPLDKVTAFDKEDGDITSKIKVIHDTVDTSKEGMYEVIYEVEDGKGAKATKKIKILVKSLPEDEKIVPSVTIPSNKEEDVTSKKDELKNKENSNLKKTDESVKNLSTLPKTGDNSILGYALTLLCSSSLLVFSYIKKK